jgi:transposase
MTATTMTTRNDRSITGDLLPCVYSVAEAAKAMGCSESTVRRHVRGLTGWVALTTPGAQRPACCMSR